MSSTNQHKSFDLRLLTTPEGKKQEPLHLFHEVRAEDDKIDHNDLKLALGETMDMGKARNRVFKADEIFQVIESPLNS